MGLQNTFASWLRTVCTNQRYRRGLWRTRGLHNSNTMQNKQKTQAEQQLSERDVPLWALCPRNPQDQPSGTASMRAVPFPSFPSQPLENARWLESPRPPKHQPVAPAPVKRAPLPCQRHQRLLARQHGKAYSSWFASCVSSIGVPTFVVCVSPRCIGQWHMMRSISILVTN